MQDSDGLEEVTVTAQRQEQSLQSVPLAVSSLDTDDLAARQIEELKIFRCSYQVEIWWKHWRG